MLVTFAQRLVKEVASREDSRLVGGVITPARHSSRWLGSESNYMGVPSAVYRLKVSGLEQAHFADAACKE